MTPSRLICLVTHHKGGTVWLRRVFRQMAAAWQMPQVGMWSERNMADLPPEGPAFVYNWHGTLPPALLARDDLAILHLIRDPRDILLSGCTYHLTVAPEGERFLHIPRADLGGLTYQQHLNALPTEAARLRFEMANKHAETLAEMRRWDYSRADAVELRYEDLMADSETALFRSAMARLGFRAERIDQAARIFWQNSLFGGLAQPDARTGRLALHTSGGGRASRWRDELPAEIAHDYQARHGADLVALGYETGLNWAETSGNRNAG